jgi:hypothetical protein
MAGDTSGASVSSAGDVNGDGLDDLIVSSYQADPSGKLSAGKSYVVFGKTNGSAVDLSTIADASNACAGNEDFIVTGACECVGVFITEIINGVFRIAARCQWRRLG